MEKVFESYVAGQLNKVVDKANYQIKTQDRFYHLFDDPKRFLLKPDIIVRDCHSSIVLDTKWKILNPNQSNYGISQADMYQMYAYSKKYAARMVFLLYPWTAGMNNVKKPIPYHSMDDVTICIVFVDLINMKSCMKDLSLKIDEIMKG